MGVTLNLETWRPSGALWLGLAAQQAFSISWKALLNPSGDRPNASCPTLAPCGEENAGYIRDSQSLVT
jgi:hypothetical protein